MIDVEVPLLTHESKWMHLHEASGERGLIAVCVGRAGGRGFQLLHRFAVLGEQLDSAGVSLVFVYPAESARLARDALSVLAARYRGRPCLLLDEAGRFFGNVLPLQRLRVMRFNQHMARVETVTISVQEADWDSRLSEFLAGVLADMA